ncbi:MAG: alpha/beta hydrolase fold domain-containing protein [Bacteroidales bacterium]|nr:alpha/beta hydrolase fold domain-containing protein [Bacteroidales bacterium]
MALLGRFLFETHDAVRLRMQQDDTSDLEIALDIPYMDDGDAGHLFDIYRPKGALPISPSSSIFTAAGFISIMLDTTRRDLMFFIRNVVSDKADEGKPYRKYLLDPVSMLKETTLPPLYLVTSAQDIIRKDALKFARALSEAKVPHQLLDFPKGYRKRLVHVFSVQYPLWPESRIVIRKWTTTSKCRFHLFFSGIQTGIHPPLA